MPKNLSWVNAEAKVRDELFPEFSDDLWKKTSTCNSSEIENVEAVLSKELGIDKDILKKSRLFLSIGRSVGEQNQDGFKELINHCKFNLKQIKSIAAQLNLPCQTKAFPPCFEGQRYTSEQLRSLEGYVQSPETGFTGAVGVYQPGIQLNSPACYTSDSEHDHIYYNIASVAKIFTGILPLKLVHDGVISEKKLTEKGVVVPEEVIAQFPEEHRDEVRKRLSEVSLHQLMTHKAGFGDYGPGYFKEMEQHAERGEKPPIYSNHNDLLRFSFDCENNGLTEIGEPRYSNVGMVLLAAATQELYNQNNKTDFNYNEILEQELFNPADVTVCKRAPEGMACFSEGDTISPHYLASPAGCAWMMPEDVVKFGQYVQTQLYEPNPRLQGLFKNYGEEFFDAQTETIHHRGDLPGKPGCNAEFYASMKSGEVFTALSDKPNEASNLYYFSLEQLGREAGLKPVEQKADLHSEAAEEDKETKAIQI